MKLTSVTLQNFKGGDRQIQLGGLDILEGENGSGKTRVIQAMQLALSGQVPHAIEPRNIDVLELFSKGPNVREMIVEVETDNTAFPGVARRFTLNRKNGKDSVSQEIRLTQGTPFQPPTEAEKKVREHIGEFPIMLDVHKFIRMSDQERAKLIFSFCPVDVKKWTAEAIVSRLTSYCAYEKLEAVLVVEVITGLSETIKVAYQPATFLSLLLDAAKAKESALKKEEKNNAGSALASIQLAASDGKRSLRNAQDIRDDIANARRDESKLIGNIAESRATQDANTRLDQERRDLTDRIAKERERIKPEAFDALRAELAELKMKHNPIDESLSKLEQKRSQIEAYSNDLASFNGDLKAADAEIARIQETVTSLESGACPTCGQVASGVLEGFLSKLDGAKLQRTQSAQDVKETEAYVRELKGQLTLMLKEMDDQNRANAELQTAITAKQTEITRLEGASQGIVSLETRLAELNHTRADGLSINIAEAEINLGATRERITALEAELKEKQEYDTKISLAKEAAAKSKKAEDSLAIVKVLIKEIQAIRFEIVKEALKPVSAEAGELFCSFSGGAGLSATFSFQFEDLRGNEVFKFGWVIDSVLGEMFVDFDSLSTAQQTFTLVALLAPLIHRGSPELRVLLLDNVEVISERYRADFIAMLDATIGRYLDNVIMASSSPFNARVGTTHRFMVAQAVAA
jgi:septum formation topological specificity factor MinE